MRYFRMVLALAVILLTSVGAYAATDIYKDTYTTEDSVGEWTFTSVKGVIAPTTFKGQVSIVSATPATITTAAAGTTYIAIASTSPNHEMTGTTISFTLPPASTTTAKVAYKFVSGDGTAIIIRPNDAARDNIFWWGKDLVADHIPAGSYQMKVERSIPGAVTTGTTIEVTMGSNGWYVNVSTPTSVDMETSTVNPMAL